MDNNVDFITKEFLDSSRSRQLSDKKDDIIALASTDEGKKVMNMLDKSGQNITDALKNGDMDSIKKSVSQILKTDAGAALAAKLSEMMK